MKSGRKLHIPLRSFPLKASRMKRQEKQKVAETLTEKPFKIKVGMFTFRVKQPTLGQLYEMGAIAVDIDEKDIQQKVDTNQRVNILAECIAHYNDARLMQEIFLVLVFRKRFWRWFWKRYILHRLTVGMFGQLTQAIGQSVNINFFLTSIIFLKRTTAITEPSRMTARGLQSEG